MYKLLFGLAALFGAMTMTGRAFAEDGTPANGPTKLTDAQLDEVTAGHTPALTLAARHEGHCHHHHHHHHHHNRAVFGASGLPGNQPTTQVTFIIRDVTFTFNIGPNSPVNLAAVLQLSLLSQPIQSGSATALQAGR